LCGSLHILKLLNGSNNTNLQAISDPQCVSCKGQGQGKIHEDLNSGSEGREGDEEEAEMSVHTSEGKEDAVTLRRPEGSW
jgi:hypothetical protein